MPSFRRARNPDGAPVVDWTMLGQCFFCDRPFPAVPLRATTTPGRTIAYDPHRGRLWLVCSYCRRWSLTPIDARWETLEELERWTRDRARLLADTTNVSLLAIDNLLVVRVGRAQLREQAWWRYSRELMRRHQRTEKILQRGEVVDTILDIATPIIGLLLIGWPLRRYTEPGSQPWLDRARWRDFGPYAYSGELRCHVCGAHRDHLLFAETADVTVEPSDEGVGLCVRCPQCRSLSEPGSGFHLSGHDAARVLRRMLAYQNYDGASARLVDAAMTLIEDAGSPAELSQHFQQRHARLGALKVRELLALEIAANDEDEQRLAELEVASFERVWREEEQIAALADGELTPWPG